MKPALKNRLIASALLAAVFCAVYILCRYTFLQKEYFGLFLNTPDYWSELRGGPRPLLTFLGDFTVQFFRFAWAGPALAALGAGACYLILGRFLRRVRIPLAVVLFAACLTLCLLPKTRERERWAKVEYTAIHAQWDKLAAAATPQAADQDPMLMPYAFLALSEQGLLADHIFRYPVAGPQDMDAEGELTLHGYLFSQIQAEAMGSTNEALHNAFQVACTLPHGCSHGTIRSLIKYNLAAGNALLARKYADLLARSPANRATARAAHRLIDRLDGSTPLDSGPSEAAATITHNTLYNMKAMAREGLFDAAAAERSRCLLLLQRDLRSFVATFPEDEDYSRLPAAYQQALCLILDPQAAERLSSAVRRDFDQYSKAFDRPRMKGTAGAILPGSYWDYYFLMGF